MENEIDNLEKAYDRCVAYHGIRDEKDVETEQIQRLVDVSAKELDFVKGIKKNVKKDSSDWTFVFRHYFDSLGCLLEAFMLFDGVTSNSPQCKHSYLCLKHPELELDWEFLETIRIKREGINKRGFMLGHQDWQMMELKFELCISKMKEEIGKKLN